ncbi:MAG: AIR synthase-related protein [Candidatus Riflebacteria bacterium]
MENSINKGQNLDLGNRCSKIAFTRAKTTFSNRQNQDGEVLLNENASFCNIVGFGKTRIGICSDGIGTKIEVAERCGIYDSLGFDLTAMVVDDLIANGVEPTSITNILDVDRLSEPVVDELMKGLAKAAEKARVSVTGGEIAELGQRIGGYGSNMHFNWCATAIGKLPEGRNLIDGCRIRENDAVIALYNRGLRSNGYSLARRILFDTFGDSWHNQSFDLNDCKTTWGQVLLFPSVIYAAVVNDLLNQNQNIHGIAHITGGGLPDNLGRLLRVQALGAELNDLFEPEKFFLELQKLGRITDHQAYHSWNMNHGMLLIVPPDSVEEVIGFMNGTEITTRKIGRITGLPGIRIHSRGLQKEILQFDGKGK